MFEISEQDRLHLSPVKSSYNTVAWDILCDWIVPTVRVSIIIIIQPNTDAAFLYFLSDLRSGFYRRKHLRLLDIGRGDENVRKFELKEYLNSSLQTLC